MQSGRLIQFGSSPRDDEIEVSLFGPGYGEAIAVHLGSGAWLLVDSCIGPWDAAPVTVHYLRSIGIPPAAVKAVVASHWHDDHVRGIAQLVKLYQNAEFYISSVFTQRDALALLCAYGGAAPHAATRGARELYQALTAKASYHLVSQRSAILELGSGARSVHVNALSPAPAATTQFIAGLAEFLPHAGNMMPIGNIVPLEPNAESVVLHIDCGDDAVLLGSDLEEHPTYGWSAMVTDSWVAGRRPASVSKVAHHGSVNGDSPCIWSTLLDRAPVAALTPFNRGSVHLPTREDVTRLKNKASQVWISSGATLRPNIPSAQLKRLNRVAKRVVPVNNGFGCVRLRRRRAQPWRVECFGDARAL